MASPSLDIQVEISKKLALSRGAGLAASRNIIQPHPSVIELFSFQVLN